MNIFTEWNLSDIEMRKLNRYILYLQIVTVSDLTNYEGTQVLDKVLLFDQPRHSIWKWPQQERPV